MRGLLALVVGMGVLIVAGVAVIGVTLVHRLSRAAIVAPMPAETVLDQPAGTQINGVAGWGDRLLLSLRGGGPDRVVIVEAGSGRVLGEVRLGR